MDTWFAVYLFYYKLILFSQVAKSVSLRLHSELEAIQKKNSRLEWENEGLRERLQDLEVTKQVLQAEMDKSQVVWPQSHCTHYCSKVEGLCFKSHLFPKAESSKQ